MGRGVVLCGCARGAGAGPRRAGRSGSRGPWTATCCVLASPAPLLSQKAGVCPAAALLDRSCSGHPRPASGRGCAATGPLCMDWTARTRYTCFGARRSLLPPFLSLCAAAAEASLDCSPPRNALRSDPANRVCKSSAPQALPTWPGEQRRRGCDQAPPLRHARKQDQHDRCSVARPQRRCMSDQGQPASVSREGQGGANAHAAAAPPACLDPQGMHPRDPNAHAAAHRRAAATALHSTDCIMAQRRGTNTRQERPRGKKNGRRERRAAAARASCEAWWPCALRVWASFGWAGRRWCRRARRWGRQAAWGAWLRRGGAGAPAGAWS